MTERHYMQAAKAGLRPGMALTINSGTSVEVVRVSDGVPSWCFSRLLRGFVMANALAAPREATDGC